MEDIGKLGDMSGTGSFRVSGAREKPSRLNPTNVLKRWFRGQDTKEAVKPGEIFKNVNAWALS